MPLYVADYDADTAHLTLAEDGAYSRLLRLSWRTPGCTMPEDDDWIMRRMRVDREEFDRLIKPIISEFFSVKKGRVFSARLQHEFERINATSKMRSIAGKKGGHPRKAQKANGKDLSPAKTKRKQLEPEPEPNPKLRKKDTKVSKKNEQQPFLRLQLFLNISWLRPWSWVIRPKRPRRSFGNSKIIVWPMAGLTWIGTPRGATGSTAHFSSQSSTHSRHLTEVNMVCKPTAHSGFNALSKPQQQAHREKIGVRAEAILCQFWRDDDTPDAVRALEIEGWCDVLENCTHSEIRRAWADYQKTGARTQNGKLCKPDAGALYKIIREARPRPALVRKPAAQGPPKPKLSKEQLETRAKSANKILKDAGYRMNEFGGIVT